MRGTEASNVPPGFTPGPVTEPRVGDLAGLRAERSHSVFFGSPARCCMGQSSWSGHPSAHGVLQPDEDRAARRDAEAGVVGEGWRPGPCDAQEKHWEEKCDQLGQLSCGAGWEQRDHSEAPSSSLSTPHRSRICHQVGSCTILPLPAALGLWKCLSTRGCGKMGIFPRSREG